MDLVKNCQKVPPWSLLLGFNNHKNSSDNSSGNHKNGRDNHQIAPSPAKSARHTMPQICRDISLNRSGGPKATTSTTTWEASGTARLVKKRHGGRPRQVGRAPHGPRRHQVRAAAHGLTPSGQAGAAAIGPRQSRPIGNTYRVFLVLRRMYWWKAKHVYQNISDRW